MLLAILEKIKESPLPWVAWRFKITSAIACHLIKSGCTSVFERPDKTSKIRERMGLAIVQMARNTYFERIYIGRRRGDQNGI